MDSAPARPALSPAEGSAIVRDTFRMRWKPRAERCIRLEEASGRLVRLAVLPHLLRSHLSVGDHLRLLQPPRLDLPRGPDQGAHPVRGLGVGGQHQLLVFNPGNVHEQVDEVQQQTADPALVPGNRARGARALADGIAGEAATAGALRRRGRTLSFLILQIPNGPPAEAISNSTAVRHGPHVVILLRDACTDFDATCLRIRFQDCYNLAEEVRTFKCCPNTFGNVAR